MIYVHIHEHRWNWTGKFIHGERIARCLKCGDEAYGHGIKVRAVA